MKKLFILPVLLISIAIFGFVHLDDDGSTGKAKQSNTINWITIEEAQKLGKQNPKKVFIDVYTDWCGWCKVMDKQTFSDEDIIKYVNENYYAIKLNAESREPVIFNGTSLTKAELAKSFRVTGYPTIVFVDETFQNFQPVPGFHKPENFKKMLMQFNGSAQ
jgi:thioredoxin-related protein